MSEQSSEYNPMSLHGDIEEIYTSQEILEHLRIARIIGQRATHRRFRTQPKIRLMETIHAPDLFGSRGTDFSSEPPIAPELPLYD